MGPCIYLVLEGCGLDTERSTNQDPSTQGRPAGCLLYSILISRYAYRDSHHSQTEDHVSRPSISQSTASMPRIRIVILPRSPNSHHLPSPISAAPNATTQSLSPAPSDQTESLNTLKPTPDPNYSFSSAALASDRTLPVLDTSCFQLVPRLFPPSPFPFSLQRHVSILRKPMGSSSAATSMCFSSRPWLPRSLSGADLVGSFHLSSLGLSELSG